MKRALTLLEVIVGNFLILLVVLAVFALLAGTLGLGHESERWLSAEHLAQDHLLRLQQRKPEELAEGQFHYREDIFEVDGRVERVSQFEPDQLKQVVVNVTWQERGRHHQLRRHLRVCGLECR